MLSTPSVLNYKSFDFSSSIVSIAGLRSLNNLRKKQVKQRKQQVSNESEIKRERKEEGEQKGKREIPLAGAPESPSMTLLETRRGREGLENGKAKKVEKQQTKGEGADLTVSRGAPKAGEQRRQLVRARVTATQPSPFPFLNPRHRP